MKKTFLLVVICLVFCFWGNGQISRNITTNPLGLKIEKVGEYDKLSISKVENTTTIVSHPELPVYYKSFVIPRDVQLNGIM